MVTKCLGVLLVLSVALSAEPQRKKTPRPSLNVRIDALLAGREARQAFWGLQVVDLASGRILHERNASNYFAPASNTKLFSTALALVRLGPEYQFRTSIRGAAPDGAGVVKSDLVLVGGGDPTLSGRVLPYSKDTKEGDPMHPMEELAVAVFDQGVRRIEGDIAGDDTAYRWEPYPGGWSQDDAAWYYGAPVSALMFNENSIKVTFRPGRSSGDLAELTIEPAIEHFIIHNHVVTSSNGSSQITLERVTGSREVHAFGRIAMTNANGRSEYLAVDDPALFAAQSLYEALLRRGISIGGRPVARHRVEREPAAEAEPAGVELVTRESLPLIEILKVVNKVSQNLIAEILVREVAHICRGYGTIEGGLDEMKAFLDESGVPVEDVRIYDGSGLSRRNHVTPRAIIKLLEYMYRSPHRDRWMDLMPIGGEDGTLRQRFLDNPRTRASGRRVHAKTGTLTHATALAGYVDRTRGHIAFSVVVNFHGAPTSEVRGVIDKIVLSLTN